MSGYQKISVNLSDEVLGAARALAESKNVTLTEVLRRAISTRVFLEQAQRDGKAVLLKDPKTNEIERLIFE
ncbi:CopG family transcriptional regulator [Nocardia sp. NPDC059239]|uniref:CopG family transcriptional regulator n=1 Tax=Nocardia sp. NPDC059239 TaxID=3346785 RepID=UPI00369D79FD